jgi:two-component system chemotaxis response regulator CheB
MAAIRVLIVDDSALARAAELQPQLITMDLEMPVMGGLEAIEEIMHVQAVPILVVSGQADSTNAYQAVSRGALEVVPKPGLDQDLARELIDRVKLLAGVRVIRHLRRARREPAAAPVPVPPAPMPADGASGPARFEAVVIAASTGGPQALATLLPGLPADLPVPVLIAQHIADGFAGDMAQWLDTLTPLPVCLARDREIVAPGRIYLAPSEQHLQVSPARRLQYLPRAEGDHYHPSCDRLLESAAAVYGRRCLGLILTGMGSDGVAGLRAIRDRGGTTLAQDEASSVIYGMNGLAVQAGLAHQVLPLEQLAGAIRSRVTGRP